jgi:hypothetical protein
VKTGKYRTKYIKNGYKGGKKPIFHRIRRTKVRRKLKEQDMDTADTVYLV